jgi:hypothetical protein
MRPTPPAWLLAGAVAAFAVSAAFAQGAPPVNPRVFPAEMKNRQVLPPGTGGAQLRETMRTFALSLGVRCTHCHTGTEEMPLPERDFASDDNPRKTTARDMIRMVRYLNEERLPAIPGLEAPRVTCYTCHRGATKPETELPPEPPLAS